MKISKNCHGHLPHAVAGRPSCWMNAPYCTNDILSFLNEKFMGNVISHQYEWPWLSHSSHLNALDYFLWSYLSIEIYHQSPKSIPELILAVEIAPKSMPQNVVVQSGTNLKQISEKCLPDDGVHFQYIECIWSNFLTWK